MLLSQRSSDAGMCFAVVLPARAGMVGIHHHRPHAGIMQHWQMMECPWRKGEQRRRGPRLGVGPRT